MSWTDRLFRTVRDGANAVQDRVAAFERDGGIDALGERLRDAARRQEDRLITGRHGLNPEYVRQLNTWYARLELQPGSSADEVRQAFRALMRRYHPDRYTDDPERERKATELSQQLTVAYRGLLEHLEGGGPPPEFR